MGRTSEAKETIVKTSQILFMNKGYNSISVDRICKEAGINKGSFYHFFKSKQELLLAVIDLNWMYLKSFLFSEQINKQENPLKKIDIMFESLANVNTKIKTSYGKVIGCPVGSIANELATQSEIVRDKVKLVFDEWINFFKQILIDAKMKKFVDESVNIDETASALLTFTQGLLLMSKTQNDPKLIVKLGGNYRNLIT